MNMNERPLIIDISEHQGQLNYNALSSNPDRLLIPHIIISRAGLGKYGHQDDKQFVRNWEKCKQFGYRRQSYYAYWPYHPAQKQLDEWYRINPTIDVLPRVIDLENNSSNLSARYIADRMWEWSEEILRRDGCRPWIYSRKNLIDPWLASWTDEMLNAHYYIIAEYNNHRDWEEEGIKIPDRIQTSRVVLKQTADQMVLGPNLPVVDRDRYLLGLSTLHLDVWITTNYSDKPVDCCEELRNSVDAIYELFKEHGDKQLANVTEIEKVQNNLEALINLNAVMFETAISKNALEIKSLEDGCKRNYEHFKELEAKQKELDTWYGDWCSALTDDIDELEATQEDRWKAYLDNVGYFQRNVTKLNQRIDGLAGGHSHFWHKWEWFKKLTGYYNQRG